MNIFEKHAVIIEKLHAPKNKRNNFGGFDFRNVSGILEAVKPILKETKTTLFMKDSVEQIGDRFYVTASATLQDVEDFNGVITATASAREQAEKKGMDAAQITGCCSSYARKYALGGLFCIDDSELEPTPDPDETSGKPDETAAQAPSAKRTTTKIIKSATPDKPLEISKEAWKQLNAWALKKGFTSEERNKIWAELLGKVGVKSAAEIKDVGDWNKIIKVIESFDK